MLGDGHVVSHLCDLRNGGDLGIQKLLRRRERRRIRWLYGAEGRTVLKNGLVAEVHGAAQHI